MAAHRAGRIIESMDRTKTNQPNRRFLSRSGRDLVVRPITLVDVPEHNAFAGRLSAESRRLRFFTPVRSISLEYSRELCDMNFVTNAAFVVTEPQGGAILGVGRYAGDSVATAELALTVDDAWQGEGIGAVLLARLIEHARSVGILRLTAQVLRENRSMLGLLHRCGLPLATAGQGAAVVVTLQLDSEPAPAADASLGAR
jgi:GNAT superfamily N-acetyltransferase